MESRDSQVCLLAKWRYDVLVIGDDKADIEYNKLFGELDDEA